MTDNDLARFFELDRLQSQRSKYLLADAPKKRLDPRRVMANEVEHDAAQRLRAMGFQVSKQTHKAHFDLLADGLRCEVKAARWDGHKYLFNLHDNDADCLMLFCADAGCWFIAPFAVVDGRSHAKITQRDPRDYAGRLRTFYEAWDILPDLAKSACNPYQANLL